MTGDQRPPAKARREGWLWRGVKRRMVVKKIDFPSLKPQATSVSSMPACEFLCSYNWVNCKKPVVTIPGFAPIWQNNSLPITLPKDKGVNYIDQNSFCSPQYPFRPLFQSLASMKPQLCFDDVDVVVNRISLRKLLDFCEGRVRESFRINLSLVGDTLFIERCERSLRSFIKRSHVPGYGRSFEEAFTKYPRGLEDSIGHHRVIQYPLGDLNCVVQFEVDACYQGQDFSSPLIDQLTISDRPEGNTTYIKQPETRGRVMPQSMVAELKSKSKLGSSMYMPQLWFGRTPWLIIGHHTQGIVDEVKVVDAAARFLAWETKHQTELRKVAAVLSQLREAVRKNEGRNCSAIYLKHSLPRSINIFPLALQTSPLPEYLVGKFWRVKNT
ncbi:hypothetical protein F5X99DRAFT_420649 [Biscogniauxia marginata]|nr:hypothetical protein F5X99DRAFT_420649 [Biscogniauxia marginata]